ncbi:MAG: DHH family phosphoesterase [Methanocalculus sp. MSAO_Arc1]|uniref:DHH family phosphoesterase n=1 Tax=Methanocalculus TaxID=71151 RepID=UPI000FF6287F|nr:MULTISPECIES: DHH family phosphoesterase [unclassified Methanocalculus]MCP1662226.1 single-stranded DNA-specific DHH superfamily exonuclease [Methanocalculus sp. AMF5]RQD81681.1 MAG: DHH family phosphoesterase [Methanocalculus sp. MSAO_Arc1]
MPFSSSAEKIADHLQTVGFVEVHAHHDADGIAAASLICTALSRIQVPFHLRIRENITAAAVPQDRPVLLCDFGSSLQDLPESVMVIDHHVPSFTGEFHVNPRLHGIDGDLELSTSGAAYQVALHLGDNRDLAGLALLGVIGDKQEISGENREIVHEGIANGVISTKHAFALAGRDLYEQLFFATDPFLPDISGNDAVARDLCGMVESGTPPEDDPVFLSRLVLETGSVASAEALQRIVSEIYELEREVIAPAPAMAAVIDACGKSGRGGLAVSLCMGDPAGLDEAWEIFTTFRQRIITGYNSAASLESGWYTVNDTGVVSDIADLLASDLIQASPVFVLAKEGEICRVSARSSPGLNLNLDSVISEAASAVGGSGGGHGMRAGATIPQGGADRFRQIVTEAIAAC